MNKKIFSVAVVAIPLALCLSAAAQQAGRIPTIGILRPGSSPDPLVEEFRRGLRELGYIEGRHVAIEYRYAEGKLDRLSDLAADLVRLKVDVIVVGGPTHVRAAKQATQTIPIIMGLSGDPVRDGFVATLARPGGNVTGLSRLSPELSGKRLELLKETVPKIQRVAVFLNPANPSNVLDFEETDTAARSMGLKLQSLKVRNVEQLEPAFATAVRDHVDALMPGQDPLLNAQSQRILDFATKNRLPTMCFSDTQVEGGGLMSYAPSDRDLYRRAATYVDKILKGAKPSDLPVEQPTKFELVINLKTAKQIGVTIPPNVLARADRVIR
jgi:ABC-type uncharacterized transport system substrate-binding protein